MYFAASLIGTLVAALFRPLITPIKTGPASIAATVPGQQGAMSDYAGLATALQSLATNGSPAFGNWTSTLVPNLAAATYQGNQLPCGIIRRFSPAANYTDSTDTAANIIAAIPGAIVNQTFPFLVANLGSGIGTLAAGTGVTIAGTATIASNATRLFLGQVTGSAAVTITSLFQWGNGTGYTNTTGL
jgi:hypothetical protein